MELRRQLSLVWRSAWLLVLCASLAGALGYLVSASLPKVYESSATLIVGRTLTDVGLDYNQLLAAQGLAATFAEVATTRPLLDRVVQTEALSGSADDLRGRVSVTAPANSTFIVATVADTDRDRAARIANDIGSELIAISPTENGLTVIEPAVPAIAASSPRVLVNTGLAAVAGLLLALGLIFIRDYLNDTVRSEYGVQVATGVPSLGFLPAFKRRSRRGTEPLPTAGDPQSETAEAFRVLMVNLERSSRTPLRSLLVTSAAAGEGKTTVAAYLAVAFAEAGHRTLLVDAALDAPGTHRIFQLGNERGLTTLLEPDHAEDSTAIQPTDSANLQVLTSGPVAPDSVELLHSAQMKALLQRLGREADLVIIDSSHLNGLADAALLSTMVDGTLLVVWGRRTRRGALRRARDSLFRVNATLLGVAVNHLDEKTFTSYDPIEAVGIQPGAGD